LGRLEKEKIMKQKFLKHKKTKKKKPSANKKGTGFYMFRPPSQKALYEKASKRLRIAMLGLIITMSAALYLTSFHVSFEITIALITMSLLMGLLIYDMASSHIWDKSSKTQLKTLENSHDRLVREVARNRDDIALLKIAHKQKAIREPLKRTKDNASILKLEINPPPVKPPAKEINNRSGKLSNSFITELLHYTIKNDMIEAHIQPVVTLPQRQITMYEAFARLPSRSGTYLTASRYLNQANKEGLIPNIDNLLLLRCLSMIRDPENLAPGTAFIINISPATIRDKHFMEDLITFLSKDRKLASCLIFELPQLCLSSLTAKECKILEALSIIGCRFSVDRVRSKVLNLNLMQKRKICFLKLDANWLLKETRTQKGAARIKKLKKMAEAAGIELIAEKIETEGQIKELLDFDIAFGQGYIFGKPDIYNAYRDTQNLKHGKKLYKKSKRQ
jgi:cyclic-di-GMP phosphodiesterase TipF (flagellum assembly factor)